MKTWVKVLIIILAVMVVLMAAAVVFGIYTYNQVKDVVMLSQDKSFQQNFEALANGDCSKLPVVESQVADLKTKLSALCGNPTVKIAAARGWIKAEQYATCKEINNPDNQVYKALDMIKDVCANKTVTK